MNWRPLPLSAVQVTDPFWLHWMRLYAEQGLRAQYEQCKATGRIENFRRAARKERGTYEGRYYNDSDVYKYIEAACLFQMALGLDTIARSQLEEVVEAVISAQREDGYLHTYFQVMAPEEDYRNLSAMHELYCQGHLIEAAVAHHQATGVRDFLNVAIRLADHIDSVFGEAGRHGYCGHEELELALLKLADHVGEPRYRMLACRMIDLRGSRPSIFEEELKDPVNRARSPWMQRMLEESGAYSGAYVQDHLPVRETRVAAGHAVRAMYLYAAAEEAYGGEPDMDVALDSIWHHLVDGQMYVTGGIGSVGAHEGFGPLHDLPNRTAYAETCAACGLIFWAQRRGNRLRDGDVWSTLELALYNAALPGIGLDGKSFHYDNPLESYGDFKRKPWFDCACCPPNLGRVLGGLGGYLCSAGPDEFAINLHASFQVTPVLSGVTTRIVVEADALGSGVTKIEVHPEVPTEFTLFVRIPEWSRTTEVEHDDSFGEMDYLNGYAALRRTWNSGDTLTVKLINSPQWMRSKPQMLGNAGRAALRAGPLIFCLEEAGLGRKVQQFTADLSIEPEIHELNWSPANGLIVEGFVDVPDSEYCSSYEEMPFKEVPVTALFVPYCVWNNRETGTMQVWVRALPDAPEVEL